MNARSTLLFLPFLLLLTSCLGMGIQEPAPVTAYGQKNGAGSAGVHNVVPGDTLYSISERYHLPMRDIAVANRLQAPFMLRDGQRLKLPPPQQYKVKDGDTLYSVSRLFGVDSSEVARLNEIDPPYTIKVGDLLRLPTVTRKTMVASQGASAPVRGVERETLAAPQGGEKIASVDGERAPVPSEKGGQSAASSSSSGSSEPHGSKDIKTSVPKRSSGKFLRPVNGNVVSDYGAKKNGLHNDGINIEAPKGTPVKAAENGVVVYAGSELKGSGNLVLIRHENGWMTAYAHMDRIDARKGAVVKRGEVIGKVGSSGSVSRPQLHFEVRRGTEAVNPKNYMD
ncbi:MAG: LysM peptidoglycan-binding domain-containing M23 family metallopeptidase [Alphaproteobacteria bacterium]|nr:LysM peptidoglycan-binding domain-containing M23 family metallopeptidase [Alphaproteobacteria bacterium]